MKLSLKEEMETLLIPLYGRAQMSRKGLFQDLDAESAISQIDYDFSKQASKRNKLISDEIKNMSDQINVDFITPSIYSVSGIS